MVTLKSYISFDEVGMDDLYLVLSMNGVKCSQEEFNETMKQREFTKLELTSEMKSVNNEEYWRHMKNIAEGAAAAIKQKREML